MDATKRQIAAAAPEHRFYAWRPLDGTRTHLTQSDAEQLGPLLAAYVRDEKRLPPRVRRAIFFCETSFRTPSYEVAYGHVVTALESLLKVEQHRATAQFAARVPALSRELGITGITKRKARAFYGRLTISPRATIAPRCVRSSDPRACRDAALSHRRTAQDH